jgi:hypothetical protein
VPVHSPRLLAISLLFCDKEPSGYCVPNHPRRLKCFIPFLVAG